MMMKMQEMMHKELMNPEVWYQELLKAKNIQIEAQGKLVKAIQTKHNVIEKQLRGYSDGDLYSIHESQRQLNTVNIINYHAGHVLREAEKSEQAKISTLTVGEKEEN